jgi:cation/acetate symporter
LFSTATIVFLFFVGSVLTISFILGSKAKSSQGYFAAHGQIHWFVNGVAFAGDYLSAASFLGICGMIAFYGYDGFLYSIGYLAGWIVALFVIAEPLKRLGRFTFADALDSQFNSRGIKLSAAIATLVISIFYLIPQMVGAGTLIKPLLGFEHATGVIIVGVVVIIIVVTAGMVSTTWVQFIKGSMLVMFCAGLTVMILNRGLMVNAGTDAEGKRAFRAIPREKLVTTPQLPKLVQHESVSRYLNYEQREVLPPTAGWAGKPYVQTKWVIRGEQPPEGNYSYGRIQVEVVRDPQSKGEPGVTTWRASPGANGSEMLVEVQTLTVTADGKKLINGLPKGTGEGHAEPASVGHISKLPGDVASTGPLGPGEFFSTLQDSTVVLWGSEKIKEADGGETTVYFQKPTAGGDILTAGASPTFKGVRSEKLVDKLDFISLMLALFCGTASLPHILIRYYTVKDQASARKSTVVGIASIGFFYVLTLFLGLGAMTSGTLDVTNSNMAAPLLARSFGELPFAIISAIAFTTVLGTVSGLILAAAGAVAHDLMENTFKIKMTDHGKVKAAKIAAVVVGIIAMGLGIVFEKMNVSFLVGWAFNIAASANLPALVMLLFWKRTTKEGITAAIVVGMVTSLAWVLLSAPAYKDVYGLDPAKAIVPLTQPALFTIPLGFVTLIMVSLMTKSRARLVRTD